MCDTQHAGKEIVTRPMSEYFANDPECHDLLPCALRSHRVAGLGGMSHRAACGWSHVHVDSGPVPFAVTALHRLTRSKQHAPLDSLNGLRLPLNDGLWDKREERRMVWYSRIYRPTRHIISHFRDDFTGQVLFMERIFRPL